MQSSPTRQLLVERSPAAPFHRQHRTADNSIAQNHSFNITNHALVAGDGSIVQDEGPRQVASFGLYFNCTVQSHAPRETATFEPVKGDARRHEGCRRKGETEKTRKRQEGESVERAVGHIIKGIRLSEYFRDTIKRLCTVTVSCPPLSPPCRYSLSCPSHLLPATPVRTAARSRASRRTGCILIPCPPSSIPRNVARSHRVQSTR